MADTSGPQYPSQYPNDVVQLANYNQYGSNNDYMIQPGVCILPLAEDAPTDTDELRLWSPVVIARLHAPYRIRKFSYGVSKNNTPAPIPMFGDTGAFIFIGGSIAVNNVLNTTYANFDWTTAAEYVYVENCVMRPQDGLVLGSPPFSQQTSEINADNYSNQRPTIGAVSQAGSDVVTGYWQGQAIVNGQSSIGSLNTTWGYNTNSFYPGNLFYSDLANGGTGPMSITLTSQSGIG